MHLLPLARERLADRRDPHSYGQPEQVRVTHLEGSWRVDFTARVLFGVVTWKLERSDPSAALVLDAKGLEIDAITTGHDGASASTFEAAKFSVSPNDDIFGAALRIELPVGHDSVCITYRTTPDASGLQWLAPEQTAGKRQPFLYSQAQAIHARSFLPCQDSPGVRFTYRAVLEAPSELCAVMAASRLAPGDVPSTPSDRPGTTTHRFEMTRPIPSYLLALAVGDLSYEALGPRTGVYADPTILAAAAHEFADLERMLTEGEALFGPYRFGRYEVLVLPPAFPFGGMENPCVTFATPTILTGDRSLVSLLAHELAHSWTGNLVTNATWSHFWLNEGFTVYAERRILEALYGRAHADAEWQLGRETLARDLSDSLRDKPGDQHLVALLAGRDPDDNVTSVPYEKGALLLRTLEEALTRPRFDRFLRGWCDAHAFESVATASFVDDLTAFLAREEDARPTGDVKTFDLTPWFFAPGIPQPAHVVRSPRLEAARGFAAQAADPTTRWADLPFDGWSTQERLAFLRALPDTLTTDGVAALDAAFHLCASTNAEVLAAWLERTVGLGFEPACRAAERFLATVGRRKFVLPLFRALLRHPAGPERARALYVAVRPGYHAITRRTLDTVLGV